MNRTHLLPSTLIVLLTVAVLIYLVEKLGAALLAINSILITVGLAWLLAAVLLPPVNWLRQRTLDAALLRRIEQRWGAAVADRFSHPSRGVAILIVYSLLVTGLAIVVVALIPLVIEQTRQLSNSLQQQASSLPVEFQRLTDFINSARDFLITRLQLDPALIVLPKPEEIVSQLSGLGTGLVQFTLGVVGGVASALGQFALIMFLSVLIMIDGPQLGAQFMRLIPRRYEDDVRFASQTISLSFGSFIRGTLLQSFIYGIGVAFFMTLFDVKSAVAVGVGTGVLMIVPLLGGPLGLIIPLLVGIFQGSPNTPWLIIALIVLQFVLFNVVTPRLLSKSLRMPSLLVIVSLLVGSQLIGVWGFFFAVPIAAILYSMLLLTLERIKRTQDKLDANIPEATHEFE